MSRRTPPRIPTSGSSSKEGLDNNPFAALSSEGLPSGHTPTPPPAPAPKSSTRSLRFRVRRETAGRKGKTVTLIEPLDDIHPAGVEDLARSLRQRMGAGGTVRQKIIELQGDRVDTTREWLEQQGHRVRN